MDTKSRERSPSKDRDESCEHTPERNGDRVNCAKCGYQYKVLLWPTVSGKRKYISDIALERLSTPGIRSIIGKSGWRFATAHCRKENSEFSKLKKPMLWKEISPGVEKEIIAAVRRDLNQIPEFRELLKIYWFEDDLILKRLAHQMYETMRQSRRKMEVGSCTEGEQEENEEQNAKAEQRRKAEIDRMEEERRKADIDRVEEEQRRKHRDIYWR